MSKARILIVEDESRYVYIVKLNLEARGYEVLVARDGETGVCRAAVDRPDLVILDLMLPGIDGYEACRQIRLFSQVPILMLTARAEETSKITGLDLGADDYVIKPFSVEELLARVRAVLRRAEAGGAGEARQPLQAGPFRIDMAQQRVFRGQEEILLTPIEYRLLHTLIANAGKVVIVERLLSIVWETGEGSSAALQQAIYRLRRKIEPDPAYPSFIHTRSGLGYVFQPPDDPAC